MNLKFTKLFESALQRYSNTGFLAGDLVVFKDKAFKDEWYMNAGTNTQEKLRQMATGGLNLRVSAVKNKYPAVGAAGDTSFIGSESDVDIVAEIAPGRYMDFVTVPSRLLDVRSSYPNLPDVPEIFKKGDPAKRVNIKPKRVKDENQEVPFYTPQQTRLSDIGNKKLSKGDRELLNKNIKIPSVPVASHKDPASYTYNYLPKS
jgi:hypothetical protein